MEETENTRRYLVKPHRNTYGFHTDVLNSDVVGQALAPLWLYESTGHNVPGYNVLLN